MGYLKKNAKLDIKCPECGHKFKKMIGRLNRDFNCPKCRARIKTKQFARELRKAEKLLRNFFRGIG